MVHVDSINGGCKSMQTSLDLNSTMSIAYMHKVLTLRVI